MLLQLSVRTISSGNLKVEAGEKVRRTPQELHLHEPVQEPPEQQEHEPQGPILEVSEW